MRVRVAGLVAVLLVTLTPALAAAADEPTDPTAPVVVDDTVTMWPGGTTTLNVLANDSDPGGDDLAVCRLPVQDLYSSSDLWVLDAAVYGAQPGTLQISASGKAHGTYAIDYYTCNHTRLTPATLTVEVMDPKPVVVRRADRPGRVEVVNHNGVRVQVWAYDHGVCAPGPDGRSVPAGATRELRVHQHAVRWFATIDGATIAKGRVRHIRLTKRQARPDDSCLPAAPPVGAPARRAEEVDPEAPVVVDDVATVWPRGAALVDVLANDSDPAGDDLAVCRLPSLVTSNGHLRNVALLDATPYGGNPGTVIVSVRGSVAAEHTVHYYVCNHTRLTEATLTITVKRPEPADVTVASPGHVTVTNHNDVPVWFFATDRSGCSVDIDKRVPAQASRSFRVRRSVIAWLALIGDDTNMGIADRGRLRDIPLSGPPLEPVRHVQCITDFGLAFRQAG